MDAGVVSGFRPKAFASRMAAERVKTGARLPRAYFEISQRRPHPFSAACYLGPS